MSLAYTSAASVLEFTPGFSALYVPIVLLTVGTVLLTAIDFARPVRTSARSAAHMALRAGTALVFLALLRSGGVVAAKAGATLTNGASLDRIVDIVNGSAAIGLTVALILLLVGIALEIRSLRSRRRAAASSNPAAARTGRS